MAVRAGERSEIYERLQSELVIVYRSILSCVKPDADPLQEKTGLVKFAPDLGNREKYLLQ